MNEELVSRAAVKLLSDQKTIRKYKAIPPSERVLRDCIALAQRAPSTSNHQPYCVVEIKDIVLRSAVLAEMVCQPYVFDAPVLLLVCVDWSRQDLLAQELGASNCINKSSKLVVGIADASIFAHTLVLALQAHGLGVSYVASPYTALKKVAALLDMPLESVMPLHMISVGYADESPLPRPRYPIDSIVHTDRYEAPQKEQVRDYFETGSKLLEQQAYFAVTGDAISTWREHYKIKFGAVANERTWAPLARDLQEFFKATGEP